MKKNIGVHFLRNFAVDLEELQYVATTFSFLSSCYIYFVQVIFKRDNSADVIL